jgi:hypothetical protein
MNTVMNLWAPKKWGLGEVKIHTNAWLENQGTRSVGVARHRWENNVRRDLEEILIKSSDKFLYTW